MSTSNHPATSTRDTTAESAPLVVDASPEIASLSLSFADGRGEAIALSHARAFFWVACDDDCAGGGYDFTDAIMAALRASATRFHGQAVCHGRRAGGPCLRRARFVGRATYWHASAPHEGDTRRTRRRSMRDGEFR
jgi:hypothetical protein